MAFPTGIGRAWQRISKSLFQTGDSTIEVYDGVKPQSFYVYNTKSGSGYERVSLGWNANVVELKSEAAGSGTVRPLNLVAPVIKSGNAKATFFDWGDTRLICDLSERLYYRVAGSNNATLIIGGGNGSSVAPRFGVSWYGIYSGFTTYGFYVPSGGFTFGSGLADGNGDFVANPSFDPFTVTYQAPDLAASAAKIVGANVVVRGGNGASSSAGAANGGNLSLSGGAGYGTGTKGIVTASRLRADGFATATAAKTADYTATLDDGTIEVDASGAARTITLFAASNNAGKILVIKKTDSSANAVTVDGNASETIDGATTISLASQYSTAILQVNAAGTGWNKLAGV